MNDLLRGAKMDDHVITLVEQFEVDVLVPSATEITLEELQKQTDQDDGRDGVEGSRQLSTLSSLPLRTSLHFGGSLPYVKHMCQDSYSWSGSG